MNWSKYRNQINILIATTGGCLATFFATKFISDFYEEESNAGGYAWNGSLSSTWLKDWDCREPQTLARKVQHELQEEETSDKAEQLALRHIILVRHGEYINFTDGTHHLTDRGRYQSRLTGQRLAAMGIQWDHIVASTMTRAQETAKIIIKEINFDPLKLKKCTLLPEGMPVPPEPPTHRWRPQEIYHRDGPRIEAAFRRYFFRASPEQHNDSYLLIVGHANVIRYFVCRALQFPPEAWSRISLNHGSITWLTIGPKGYVSIRYLGDTGFMPVEYLTNRKPKTDEDILHKL